MIKLLQLIGLIICSISVYYLLDLQRKQFSSFSIGEILFVLNATLALFLLNFYIVSLRLYFLYRQFGYKLKFSEACDASLSGQLSNLFFIPFVGSMMGQKSQLSTKNIPNTLIAFTVVYERLIVSIIGVILSLISCVLLFKPSLSYYISQYSRLIEALVVFVGVVLIFILQGFNKHEAKLAKSFFTTRSLKYFGIMTLITGIGWLVVGSSFVVGIAIFNKLFPTASYVGGGIVTSFLASLPISVNGWGIRELASIKVFGELGVKHDTALIVSLLVGISSVLAIFLLYGMKTIIYSKHYAKVKNAFGKSGDDTEAKLGKNLFSQIVIHSSKRDQKNVSNSFISSLRVKTVIGLMGYLVAFLILFQFRIHYEIYSITVNLADIFAYAALFIFVSEIIWSNKSLDFSLPNVQKFLIIITGILTLSLLIGIMNFGLTHWALLSRYFGWFCLLGYFSIGVLCRFYINDQFNKRLIDILILSITTILLVKHGLYLLKALPIFKNLVLDHNLDGYALNRNAFAFQLLTISLFHFIRGRDDGNKSIMPNRHSMHLGLILAGIIMTASRSAIITCVFLILVYSLIRTINFRQLIRYTLSSFLSLILLLGLKFASNLSLSGFHLLYLSPPSINISMDSSIYERIYTIFQGLKMGWHHPIFGAGLGAFVHDEAVSNNRFLVIHNVWVWIWAECGLLGIAVILWFSYLCLKKLYKSVILAKKNKIPLPHNETFLIGSLTIFLLMSMAHDILYQRVFWFTFGLMMLQKKSKYFLTNPSKNIHKSTFT